MKRLLLIYAWRGGFRPGFEPGKKTIVPPGGIEPPAPVKYSITFKKSYNYL